MSIRNYLAASCRVRRDHRLAMKAIATHGVALTTVNRMNDDESVACNLNQGCKE